MLRITLITLVLVTATSQTVLNFGDEESSQLDIAQVFGSGSFLTGVKNELKGIIQDLLLSALKCLKSGIMKFKVNLLKKLKSYTLSQVFDVIFDGIRDFVIEPTYEIFYDYNTTPATTSSDYVYHPYQFISL